MMEGRYEVALASARQIEHDLPEPFLRDNAYIADGFMPTSLHVMVRFGRWDDILKEPEPPAYRYVSRVMWHYARGIALAALDRTAEARTELAALNRVAGETPDTFVVGNNPAPAIYAVARAMLDGEISFREGKREQAFSLLRDAVAKEDELIYDEPPGWMHPARHALGALLIADGKAAEAEEVYREDLKRNRENGWALTGMEQALRAQNKTAEADAIHARRDAAWARAEVSPVASCYCQPAGK
jgi:tetratricopeptide (TPR) repeat protein